MPFENLDDPNKAIYSYDRGDRMVKADPDVLWRKIHAACADLTTTWGGLCEEWKRTAVDLGSLPEEDRDKSAIAWNTVKGQICSVAYKAFGVVPLDDEGNGLTENAVFTILADFLDFREKKEPTAGASPDSLGPTAGPVKPSLKPSPGTRSGMRTGMRSN
jgi:hypothetical protein